MDDSAPGGPSQPSPVLSRRVAPYKTAALFLVVCACAALDLYGHPSGRVRAFTILLGLAALASAIAAMRMYFVVQADGVAIRYLRDESWLPWSQIDRIDIVSGVRGSETIRFVRLDGSHVDVPPSLLQPSRPTTKPAARHLLKNVVSQLEGFRNTK